MQRKWLKVRSIGKEVKGGLLFHMPPLSPCPAPAPASSPTLSLPAPACYPDWRTSLYQWSKIYNHWGFSLNMQTKNHFSYCMLIYIYWNGWINTGRNSPFDWNYKKTQNVALHLHLRKVQGSKGVRKKRGVLNLLLAVFFFKRFLGWYN